jgi:Arc/MetJ family transcription regulator
MNASIIASNDARIGVYGGRDIMRTTINLDDDLVATAQEYTGLTEKSAIVREGLKLLVQREAARRLARLGGSQPQLKPIPRRRPAR